MKNAYVPPVAPTTVLAVGTVTESMWSGFRVPVVILKVVPVKGWMGVEYRVRYTGPRKCLDLGLNWYASPGDEFSTRQVNIDRAAEIKAAGY